MVFARRKSGHQAEHGPQEEEGTNSPRLRNRLSKPRSLNHNLRSFGSQPRLALQDIGSRSDVAPNSDPMRDPDIKNGPTTSTRVSELINRLEANQQDAGDSSQSSLLSLPRRKDSFRLSMSSIPAKMPSSVIPLETKDKITGLTSESSASISPVPSLDDISENHPFSRRSLFIPGAATRKSSLADCIEEEKEPTSPSQSMSPGDEQAQPMTIDDDARSFDDGDEDWLPPPVARVGTPQSLDYTHLGGLSLGSLQVVNGRVSPAPSDMSKHLLLRFPAGRDTSSDYGEFLSGDRHVNRLNGDSVYSNRNTDRDFSWQSRVRSKLNDVELARKSRFEEIDEGPASFLASEYMAELPPSPYSVRKSSLPNFADRAAAAQLSHAQIGSRSQSVGSDTSYESVGSGSGRIPSPASSTKSQASTVLVTTTKRTENEDELFDDEAVGWYYSTDRDATASWHSAISPADARPPNNECFQSALGHVPVDNLASSQAAQSTASVIPAGDSAVVHIETALLPPVQSADVHELHDRGIESMLGFRSPVELEPLCVSTTTSNSPEPVTSFHQSDSGYSSNASLKSASNEPGQPTSKRSMETDRRSFVDKVFRPILKTRKTASSDIPSFDNIRPSPPSSTAASTTILSKSLPTSTSGEPVKKPKKLTKRLASSKQKHPIILQTIQSIDDLTIPPVSAEASENLRIRTEALPELQTTYNSMNHVRNRLSVSTLSVLDDHPEIRFPSPDPDSSNQQRPRSWFGRSKDEKAKPGKRDSRDVSGISQAHAMAIVNDWETMAPSLGGSNYDQIPSRKNSMQQQQQLKRYRHRSMMDDKTAAELARYRSSSIRERDAWNKRRSMEIHRKSSGNKDRSSSAALVSPPQQPRSLFSGNQQGDSTSPMLYQSPGEYTPQEPCAAPPPPPHSPRPQSVCEERVPEHSTYGAPPPPPPHSPLPATFCQDDYVAEPGILTGDEELAPPPPSHSPLPVDITEEDPWAVQAAAWKSHREHASSFHGQTTYLDRTDQVYPVLSHGEEQYLCPSKADSMHSCEYADDFGHGYSSKAPQTRQTTPTYNPISNRYEQDYEEARAWNDRARARGRGWHHSTAWTCYDDSARMHQTAPVVS